MDWNDIGLVLSRTWHIQVLAEGALSFDSHVELWLLLGFVEIACDLIFAWSRHIE